MPGVNPSFVIPASASQRLACARGSQTKSDSALHANCKIIIYSGKPFGSPLLAAIANSESQESKAPGMVRKS